MQRSILLFLTFFWISQAYAQKQTTGYEIKVKFLNYKDTLAFLGNYYGDKQYLKDTTRIDKNGMAVFKGKEKLPGGMYLIVTPDKKYFEVIIDKEQNFYMEADSSDFIGTMKIKGSEENALFYEYLRTGVKLQKEMMALNKSLAEKKTKADSLIVYDKIKEINKELEDYRDQFVKAHPGIFLTKLFAAIPEPTIPEAPLLPNGRKDSLYPYQYFKNHFFDNVDLSDDRLLRSPIFHQKISRFFNNVVVQIPDSIAKETDRIIAMTKGNPETFKYLVWWLTYTYETSKIMGMDAVFVHMVEKYYMTKQVTWVDSAQMAKIIDRAKKIAPNMLGNKAPQLKMRDMYLNSISMDEIKSPYLVLVFWDPTCGHCKKEIPKLDSLYKKSLKSKGVEVFAINLEGDQKVWMDFVNEHDLRWINVWDPYNESDFRKKYDIYSTPVIYLLDKERKIVAKRIGVEQLGDVIDKIIERDQKKSQ
jgi:thiol-disulfide isomerase/thioredoxin